MRFKNAFHIMIDNFSNVYKLLLYTLISGLIFFSLMYVVLTLGLRTIIRSEELKTILQLVKEFIDALFSGNTEYLKTFQDAFGGAVGNFITLLGNNIGSIVGSIVGVCALYLLYRFMNGLAIFTMGCVVNDRMTLCARTPFSAAFFQNLGRASVYTVIYVPLAFVYDVLSLIVSWFFFFYALSFLPLLLTIPFTVTAVVCLQALKYTLISHWMPSVIAGGEKVGKAFRMSLRHGKRFGKRFSNFLVMIYLVVAINLLFGIFTLGSALFLIFPMSFLIVLCLQFSEYFGDENRKYFVSGRMIAEEKQEQPIP